MAAIRCSFLTTLTRRPATAALTAAAASSRAAGPATLRAGHLAAAVRQLGGLHGAAVVCSAGGSSGGEVDGVMEVQLKVGKRGALVGMWRAGQAPRCGSKSCHQPARRCTRETVWLV